MITVLMIVHLILALALVITVLLQRSEGGALGIGGGGGGGGGMGGLMTARGSANLMTRTTAVLATLFICTSLILAILAGRTGEQRSIMDGAATTTGAPAKPVAPAQPAKPASPSVPIN